MKRISKGRRLSFVMLVLFALLSPFLVYVGGRLEIVQTGYEMDALADRLHELEQENRTLRLEKARLESLPRIEKAAAELGFERLPLERLLVVTDRSLTAELRPLASHAPPFRTQLPAAPQPKQMRPRKSEDVAERGSNAAAPQPKQERRVFLTQHPRKNEEVVEKDSNATTLRRKGLGERR